MLNIHDLKAAYERAIGRPTSNSTVYNLLAGTAWRTLMPRPFILDVTSRPRMIFKNASHVP
jgi:hypothetical protein